MPCSHNFPFLTSITSLPLLKIDRAQQQQQPPNKTFPFLMMPFVFGSVSKSGAGCHVCDCPVWERARPNGLKEGEEGDSKSSLL